MGFDTSLFINPVHKDLICSICLGVFEKPVFLPYCRHVFCTDCISEWLSGSNGTGNKTCPIDKTPIKINLTDICKKKISFALSNIISDSLVMCKYRNKGCKRTFSLSAFADHLKSCEFKSTGDDNELNDQSTSQAVPTTSNAIQSSSENQVEGSAQPAATTSASPGKQQATKSKKQLCGMFHPAANNAKTYFHPRWPNGDQKLVKLIFKSIALSYKPFDIAGYIKNLINIDVHCVHTGIEFPNDLIKDLNVFVLETDVDRILSHDLWPSKVTITANLEYKQITVKGSLKTLRSENFYGFNERNEERKKRKELKKKKRVERLGESSSKKSKRNRAKTAAKQTVDAAQTNGDKPDDKDVEMQQ